jgi:PleD family two-component response regulator
MEDNKPIILIVDDSSSNIKILLNILGKYDTIPCTDGKTAIDIATNNDIDLILLDIVMPDIDGFEVCKILKSSLKTKNIPIVFISAKDNVDDITNGFELGGVDYITKPFNPLELQCRVATHIKSSIHQKNIEEKNKELERLNEKIKEFAKKEFENISNNQSSNSFLGSGNIDFSNLIDNITLNN